MSTLIYQRFFMEVQGMIKIDKMEAFEIVVKLVETNENQKANELMKIISKSIEEDKINNRFSKCIEITDSKDEKMVRNLLKEKIK